MEEGDGDDACSSGVARPYELEAPSHVTETSLCLLGPSIPYFQSSSCLAGTFPATIIEPLLVNLQTNLYIVIGSMFSVHGVEYAIKTNIPASKLDF